MDVPFRNLCLCLSFQAHWQNVNCFFAQSPQQNALTILNQLSPLHISFSEGCLCWTGILSQGLRRWAAFIWRQMQSCKIAWSWACSPPKGRWKPGTRSGTRPTGTVPLLKEHARRVPRTPLFVSWVGNPPRSPARHSDNYKNKWNNESNYSNKDVYWTDVSPLLGVLLCA